jgi:hypothetical protein
MKRYLLSQWIKRISTIGVFLLFSFGIGYAIWYLISKPSESKITLTEFSQIAFDDLACDNYVAKNSSFADQLPLSLRYHPSKARLSLSADKDFYLATLKITNAEHVFITTKTFTDWEETSNETKLISPNKTFSLEIKANQFSWDSSIESGSFDEVMNIISPGAFPDYSNVTCNLYDECEGEPIYEFEWIPQNPSFIYNVGLCGENLKYLLRYESATLDNLFSLGADITPSGEGKTAWIMVFTEYPGNDSYGSKRKDTIVRIILNSPPSAENDFFGNDTPSISLAFTQLSDSSIAIHDTGTSVNPGLTLNVDYLDKQNAGNNPPIYYSSSIDKIGIKAKRIIIDSPQGTIIANYPKITIPENSDQLTVYSTTSLIDSSFQDFSYFRKKYELVGERIGASIDGKEYIPSPWEALPPELQNAYIAAAVAVALGIISIIASNSLRFASFFGWLFSRPLYLQPVNLPFNAHIFQLTNGKKISGIIDTFEGRSTFRVFVLKEVREWDKDNWSEVLPTEVRVPQNQIEMYYKAHP